MVASTPVETDQLVYHENILYSSLVVYIIGGVAVFILKMLPSKNNNSR